MWFDDALSTAADESLMLQLNGVGYVRYAIVENLPSSFQFEDILVVLVVVVLMMTKISRYTHHHGENLLPTMRGLP